MSARSVRWSRGLVLATWLVAAVACAAVTTGCQGDGPASPRQPKGTSFTQATQEDVIAARLQAGAAADTYVTIVAQAADELRAKTTRTEVALWAMEQRIATAQASFTNATGVNGYVGLLDMMVLSTLKQRAVADHWIPTLLHKEGEPVLEAYRRGERDVWNLGARVLSKKQLAELRKIIDDWQAANPTQYYVAYVRFTDFANAMRVTADSPKSRSSVFGLLYMDPLAGLDPVARELQEVRGVSERLNYLANRLPIIVAWHVDLAVYRATHDPQVTRFVDNTSKFADATKRFADAVAKYPQDLTAERTAAIAQLETATTRQVKAALDQSFAGVSEQRVALTRDLEAHENRLDATVDKVRGVVDGLGEAGRSINAATGETVETAEQSTRSILNHAFLLAVAFLAITLISLLAYRATLRRWARGAVAAAAVALLNCSGCIYDSRPEVTDEKLIERRCTSDAANAAATTEIIEKIVTRTKSQYDEFKGGRRPAPPVIDFLIISGGGNWGAFGAGFLKGWGRVASEDPLARPEFDVVTGVSTGSLIAPFAFVGDEASIDRVVHLYRNPKKDWVRRRGMLYFLPSNASFAEVPGLERELRAALTPDFVRRIADAGGDGRVLAVNTTNVDDGVPRVFDIVTEARHASDNATGDAKKDTERLHKILLASCGIPAAFPFRVIDDELYVDGGVTGNIIYGGRVSEENSLAARWASAYPDVTMPKLRYWVIFNNWLRPHPQVTPPNWPAVVTRSLEMGTRAATVTSMRHLFAMAEISRLKHDADVEVRVVAVPETWKPPKPGVFVKETMNDLADLGERMGADPACWMTAPP